MTKQWIEGPDDGIMNDDGSYGRVTVSPGELMNEVNALTREHDALRAELAQANAQITRLEKVWTEGFDDVEKHAYSRGVEDGREQLRADNERLRARIDYLETCGDCGEVRADIPRCTVCVVEYLPRQARLLEEHDARQT